MASAGRILIMPKGAYDSTKTYEMLDLVSHNGKTWLAKKTVSGIEPSVTNVEYWQDMIIVTAENAGAVQRTIWKWVNNAGDTLFSYVKSKLEQGYTSGMIQVEATNGIPTDIPAMVSERTGNYFMCSFQRHHYDYVRVTIWGDTSSYEYSTWGDISDGAFATGWTERLCPEGYLRNSGGTLTGNTKIKKTVPEFILEATENRTAIFHKNATENADAGTAIIDMSDNVRTILSIQDGKVRLRKQVDGVEVGSKIIAEIT